MDPRQYGEKAIQVKYPGIRRPATLKRRLVFCLTLGV
jgi:hypothetical protein